MSILRRRGMETPRVGARPPAGGSRGGKAGRKRGEAA